MAQPSLGSRLPRISEQPADLMSQTTSSDGRSSQAAPAMDSAPAGPAGIGSQPLGFTPSRPSSCRRASRSAGLHGMYNSSASRISGEGEDDRDLPLAKPVVEKGMFGDLKAELYENLDRKDYDVTDLYKTEGWAQALARNERFGNLTLFVIAINACWIGVDTDHNKAQSLLEAEIQFQVAENFFCIAFTFELLVRFFSFRRKRDCMTDAWFRFDSALVLLMVAETWVIPFALGGGGAGGMSNISILRLLRLLRLTRLVRIMRAIPELITMLKGVAAATRSVAATLSLLIIALYIFAIVFKQQMAEVEEMHQLFGSIPRSMWTLLLAGTFLDNLTGILQEIINTTGSGAPMMVSMFLMFVLISSLTIMNMLIGVLCEVVSAVASAEKEKSVVSYVKSQLIDVLTELDEDGTGTISKEELAAVVESPVAIEALERLGVDVPNLTNLAEVIFDMEGTGVDSGPADTVESGAQTEDGPRAGELTFAEFIELVLRLRGENSVTVPDIVDLRKFVRWNNSRLVTKMNDLLKAVDAERRDRHRVLDDVSSQVDEVREAMVSAYARIDAVLLESARRRERRKQIMHASKAMPPRAADANVLQRSAALKAGVDTKVLQRPAAAEGGARQAHTRSMQRRNGDPHDL